MYEIDTNVPECLTVDGGLREGDLKSEAEELHEVAEYVLPAALRGLDMSQVESRTDLMRELMKSIPLNEYNLPVYIYRSDLLDPVGIARLGGAEAKKKLADDLSGSIKYVSYDMGYPTLENDFPIWSRMSWETTSGFEAFLLYLELAGARGLHKIDSISPDLLSEWYHQNYWNYRALAYDSYKTAHHARLRERRIFEVQDNQFLKAGKLLEKVDKALNNVPQDKLEEVGFEKLVASFEKLAKVQRESIGMGVTAGVGKDGQVHTPTSVEVTMRRTAQTSTQKRLVDDSSLDMEALLSDPDALEQAQELIIRVNR